MGLGRTCMGESCPQSLPIRWCWSFGGASLPLPHGLTQDLGLSHGRSVSFTGRRVFYKSVLSLSESIKSQGL
jgi:hypothetical protein